MEDSLEELRKQALAQIEAYQDQLARIHPIKLEMANTDLEMKKLVIRASENVKSLLEIMSDTSRPW